MKEDFRYLNLLNDIVTYGNLEESYLKVLQMVVENHDKKVIYVVSSDSVIQRVLKVLENNHSNGDEYLSNLDVRTYKSFMSMNKYELKDIECDLLIMDNLDTLRYVAWFSKIKALIDMHKDIFVLGLMDEKIKNRIDMIRKKDSSVVNREMNIKGRSHEDRWMDQYELAREYYLAYGNLEVSLKYRTLDGVHEDNDGFRLGVWLSTQRQNYRNNNLSEERILLLKEIGFDFDRDVHNEKWLKNYNSLKEFYIRHNHIKLPIGYTTSDGFNLYIWFVAQKKAYREGVLSSDKKILLEEIGMVTNMRIRSNLTWDEAYELLKSYYLVHGNLMVPKNFKTLDGIQENREGFALGTWLLTQKTLYKSGKLSKDKMELLDKMGVIINTQEIVRIPWMDMYELAKKYYLSYGNLDVPKVFRTIDGIHEDNDGFKLGVWLSTQKQSYKNKKLSQERIKLLSEIGFDFDNILYNIEWDKMYNMVKSYYDNNGFLPDVSRVRGNVEEELLANWCMEQRECYRRKELSATKVNLLKQIGVVGVDELKQVWIEFYEDVLKYYLTHGNLDMPSEYKTEQGRCLCQWLYRQRKNYRLGRLTERQIELLKKVNFDLDMNKMTWDDMYELATVYYEHHQNLEMLRLFKTKDGVNYDEKGHNLGIWIVAQRQAYRKGILSQQRIDMLKKIGMNFERKNMDQIKKICVGKGIDVDLNMPTLLRISMIELNSKICFLEMQGVELVDIDGKMHEIFRMSNDEMKMKYNVSLGDIYGLYYVLKRKRG